MHNGQLCMHNDVCTFWHKSQPILLYHVIVVSVLSPVHIVCFPVPLLHVHYILLPSLAVSTFPIYSLSFLLVCYHLHV